MAIMGVINVTPDSFSDGGDYFEPGLAIEQSVRAFELGADLVDLGAESTRPGAAPVDPEEEWRRLGPVVSELTKRGFGERLSIDTRHDVTMLRAHELGAKWINNVSGLAKPETLAQLARDPSARYIAMHMHGEPGTMQQDPLSGEQAGKQVSAAFRSYKTALLRAGFSEERIYMDPGIGFGKTDEANLKLLAETAEFSKDYQLLVGISRKSFMGRLLDLPNPKDRDAPSKMLEFALWCQGARIVRTHEVASLARIRATLRGEC